MERRKERSNNSIQLPNNVTRRDFVGGTLLGVGSGLLTACAPGLLRSAQAQSRPSYELVGSDWTGPGGVGDYSTANGNTHEVINAAHSLRDGHWTSLPDSFVNTGEAYDLVVVGGGFAGLMSAYQFLKESSNARVLLLDNHSVFGGEAKQNEVDVDGYRLQAPQGSNMCLWPPRVMSELGFFYHPVWEELGLPMGDEPDAPTWLDSATGSDKNLNYAKEHYAHMMIYRDQAQQGYFFEDPDDAGKMKMARNPWLSGYEELNWPDEVKRELTHLDQFVLEDHPDDLDAWLDGMTYTDYLTRYVGITRPEVFEFLSTMIAAYGTGLGCDAVSALAAKFFFAPGTTTAADATAAGEEPGDQPYYPVSFPGGNTGTARHFVKKMLPDAIEGTATFGDIINGRINFEALDRKETAIRIRLNSTVIDVRHDGDPGSARRVQVSYLENKSGDVKSVTGKSVIMAGGQWMNRHVVRDAPSELLDAMGTFQHAPMLVANVAVRQWRFMEKLGITSARWLGERSWFTNIRAPLSLDGEHMPFDPDKPTVLTFYIPFTAGVSDQGLPYDTQSLMARAQLFAMPYREIEMTLRNQLATTFGPHGFDHERDIGAIIANRWGHAYVIPQKGFYHGLDGEQPPREVVRKGYGRIRFAHSELTGDQLWSTACEEGERAAKQVLEIV